MAARSYEKYDMPTGIFPYNVDIVPSGQIALVANNGGGGSPDGNIDTVSVIDLAQNPPRVIDHVVVGDAPEGFAISPKGDLALAILLAGTSDKNTQGCRHCRHFVFAACSCRLSSGRSWTFVAPGRRKIAPPPQRPLWRQSLCELETRALVL